MSTLPVLGAKFPVSMRMVVDLPAPFGPSKPSTSPAKSRSGTSNSGRATSTRSCGTGDAPGSKVKNDCPGSAKSFAQLSAALGGVGSPVEKRVRAYTLRAPLRLVAGDELFVDDAELLALVAANELDMLLSGELRHSGRPDAISEALVATIARTCDVLGAPGLARALHEARAREARFEAPLPTRMHASYRISADKQRIEALVSDVPRLLEPAT